MGTLIGAWKSLKRSPGYAAAFIATLGLAIGVNSSVFSVVNAVLLKPLPFDNADRIIYLQQPGERAGVANALFSFHEVADYREGVSAFDELVEFGDWDFSVVPADGGEPHRAVGGLITNNYFSVLGMRAALGRTTLPEDDLDGAEPVIVLTRHYWSRVFGEDPDAIGKIMELNGKNARVVGVLESGSHYTGSRQQDFYVNYATNDHYLGASMQDARTHRMTDVFARLAPGASVEAARSEVVAISDQLHREYPDAYAETMGYSVTLNLWQDELTRDARPIFMLLMGTVAAVLLLACANLANLTLTRLVRREGELMTRVALGATAPSLRRLLAAENFLLSLGGAALGVALAFASRGLLVAYATRFTVRAAEVGVDASVFIATLLVASGVAVALAYLPGMPVAPAIANMAGAAGRSTGTRARKRTQAGLVVTQLALSFTLLSGAGLLIRSLLALQAVDPGFDTENVVTMQAFQSFASAGPAIANEDLFTQAEERIRGFPGVRAVGVASFAPMTGAMRMAWNFRVEGGDEGDTRTITTAMNSVSPGYFDALGVSLLSGRLFTVSDQKDTEAVVVLSRGLARSYFGDADPIGERMARSFDGANWSDWATVVGVVEDSKQFGLGADATPTMYSPAAQGRYGQTVIVAGNSDPTSLVQSIKGAIREIDPTRPVDRIQTVEDLVAEDIAPARLNAALFGIFALLALVIAAVGVLGVLAFSVGQRTREFGLRMAIGANRHEVLRSVMFEGMKLVAIALVIGAVGAVGLSSFLAGFLFGIEPVDPLSFAAAGSVLSVVALLSALVPAMRATRVDPIQALRSE